jgi:hypothetical protein
MGWADQREVHRTGVDVQVEIKPEDLAKELESRGLPTSIFGCDVPKQIDVPRITNGHDPDPEDGKGSI